MTMREKLIELIKNACDNGKDCASNPCWDCIADGLIAQGVVTIPVRCKDCIYRDGKTPGQPNILCYNMHDDDFCSYGERRTDNA